MCNLFVRFKRVCRVTNLILARSDKAQFTMEVDYSDARVNVWSRNPQVTVVCMCAKLRIWCGEGVGSKRSNCSGLEQA